MEYGRERLLIVNPGGTTTKTAIYIGDEPLIKSNVLHSLDEMKQFKTVWEQAEMRNRDLSDWVKEQGFEMGSFDALVSRSGPAKPTTPGVYIVNEEMVADYRSEKYGSHPSAMGCCEIYSLAKKLGVPALTVDPPHSNEMMEIAHYSGHPECTRAATFHVLNQKATARFQAADLGRAYEEINLIVAHVGSGISVGAHLQGKIVDVNNGLEGDGPFTPVRTGALPVGDLIKMCFSGKYDEQDMHNQVNVFGGLSAYLGTSDGKKIEERIRGGDRQAKDVVEAMIYQIAKEIGSCAVTLRGRVDAISLTGGLMNWSRVRDGITDWVRHIAPVYCYPGENELESLAAGALRYLRGEERAQIY